MVKKEFDAVLFQREQRDRASKEFIENRPRFREALKAIESNPNYEKNISKNSSANEQNTGDIKNLKQG